MKKNVLKLAGVVMLVMAFASCSSNDSTKDSSVDTSSYSSENTLATTTSNNSSSSSSNPYHMPTTFDNLSLDMWDSISGTDGNAINDLVSKFNNEYIGQIYINRVKNATSTSYYSNIEMALSQGQGPDIIQTGNDIVPQWGYQGNVLAPLEPIMEAIGKPVDDSDFDTNVIDAAKYRGTLLELPFGIHNTVVYVNNYLWNKYINETMPTSWNRSNFSYYAKKIYDLNATEGGKKVYGLPMSNAFPGNTYGVFDSFYQNGGHFYDANNSDVPTFNTDAGYNGVKAFTDIVFDRDNWGGYANQIGNDVDIQAFQSNNALFCIDGTWCLPDLYKTETNNPNFSWHAAPVSGLYALNQTMACANNILVQSHNLGISQQCASNNDKATAAAVFIDWMSRNSVEYDAAGHIAARKSLRETDAYKALPHHSEFGASSNFVMGADNPAILYMQGEYANVISDAFSAGTNDKTTVDSLLAKHTQDAIDEIEAWKEAYGI